MPQLPAVGTAVEAGYADINLRSWNALFAPKGVAPERLKVLQDGLAAALGSPELVAQMQKVGVEIPSGEGASPAAVANLISHGLATEVPELRARVEYLD